MELFDMEQDPKQFNNLTHNPQYHEVVSKMKKALENKLAEVRNNDL